MVDKAKTLSRGEVIKRHQTAAAVLKRLLSEPIAEVLDGGPFDKQYNPTVRIEVEPCRCRVCRGVA
jgi:hypothetical protein